MITDVVVDTNVWAHADNPNESRQAASISFLQSIGDSGTKICVDQDFSLIESENRSKIGSEYLEQLSACPFAAAMLASLARAGRFLVVSTRVPNPVRARINRSVGDPSDRVFVKVAHNSHSGVLCSHDYKHLPRRCRAELRKVRVNAVSASEAMALL